jgi:hypothetical protein
MQGFMDRAAVELLVGNGQGGYTANGEFGESLQGVHFDVGLLRPFIDGDGKRYCNVRTGRLVANKKGEQEPEVEAVPTLRLIQNGLLTPAMNAAALPRLAWERIDRSVIKATRDPLRAWADLAAANTYGGFDGMSVFGLTREKMTDPGKATVSMDGIADATGDASQFDPDILPLPITSCGWHLTQRTLAVSRNSGVPLDTTLAEAAGRRVSETIEAFTIGSTDMSTFVIGASTDFTRRGIYGYTTQPDRITKSDLTTPTGANTDDTLTDVLEMIALAQAQGFYGPFMLYYTRDYFTQMESDYVNLNSSGAVAPTQTCRQRIEQIEGITGCKMLPYWSGSYALLLVQMTSDVCRAVNGMSPTTVQYEEKGGALIQFRVMCIQVPDMRSQFVRTSTSTKKAGIVHATTA